MGTSLNLDLRDDFVLDDLGDDADETISSGLRARTLGLRAGRGGDRDLGQVFTVEIASTVFSDG